MMPFKGMGFNVRRPGLSVAPWVGRVGMGPKNLCFRGSVGELGGWHTYEVGSELNSASNELGYDL